MLTWILNVCELSVHFPEAAWRRINIFMSKWWYSHY